MKTMARHPSTLRAVRAVLLAAGTLAGLTACSESADPRAAALRELVGGPARVVWVRDVSPEGTDLYAQGDRLMLMGLDTEDPRGERALRPKPGRYAKPLLSPRGDRVLFSDRKTHHFYVMNWDGSGLRDLGPGFAFDTRLDAESGVEWVYFGAEPKDMVERQDETLYTGVRRLRLDGAGEPETVWTQTPVMMLTEDNFQVSADGRRASLVAPGITGMATLPDGGWRPMGKGCWPSLAPDNSYRFWHFDGGHRTLSLYTPGEDAPRPVPVNQAPGFEGREAFHPRWSNHPRFLALDGPLAVRGGGREVEIHVGRFDEGLASVEALARLTQNGQADIQPDLWVAAGAAAWPAASEAAALATAPPPPPEDPWPVDRTGLVFVWENRDRANEFLDAEGRPVTCALEARGRARFSRALGMALKGGWFEAEKGTERIAPTCAKQNAFAFEARVTPPRPPSDGTVTLLEWGPPGKAWASVAQRGEALIFRLRDRGHTEAPAEWVLAETTPKQPYHLLINRTADHLACFIDGREVFGLRLPESDLSPWQPAALAFGDRAGGWAGELDHVALYARALTAGEAARHTAIMRRQTARQEAPQSIVVEARALFVSTLPRLRDDESYRRALVGHEYEVLRVLEGELPDPRILVGHWAILDRQPVATAQRQKGKVYRLRLEPWESRPDLKGERFVTEGDEFSLPLYLCEEE